MRESKKLHELMTVDPATRSAGRSTLDRLDKKHAASDAAAATLDKLDKKHGPTDESYMDETEQDEGVQMESSMQNEIIEMAEQFAKDVELRGFLREMAKDATDRRAPALEESVEEPEPSANGLSPMKEGFDRFMNEILVTEDKKAKSRETEASDTPGMAYAKRYGELAQNRIVYKR